MCNYSRRFVPEAASGIGSWEKIIELLIIICIPVNCLIMYFTGQNSWRNDEDTSSVKTYLSEENASVWNDKNILLLVVAIEHVLVFIKYVARD